MRPNVTKGATREGQSVLLRARYLSKIRLYVTNGTKIRYNRKKEHQKPQSSFQNGWFEYKNARFNWIIIHFLRPGIKINCW